MHEEQLYGFLVSLAKGISTQFGEKCEVTVHDLKRDLDEGTIVAIENGHVTGRKVGDSPSEIVLKALKGKERVEDQLGYPTRTADGRILKSSSIYIRDEKGALTALLGINYDVTDLYHAAGTLKQLISSQEEEVNDGAEMIFSDVGDLLDRLIEQSCEFIGKPVSMMSKEDKVRAIHYLDKKGAFLIKKAGDKVSEFYDISKYTLYNYLDTVISE